MTDSEQLKAWIEELEATGTLELFDLDNHQHIDVLKRALLATDRAAGVGELRTALIDIGRQIGCTLSDKVSTEFLTSMLPEELRLWREAAASPPAPADTSGEVAVLERALNRIGWPEIHAFQDELRKGQDIYEDAGGFMLRAIKALFGIKPKDPVITYQDAAAALIAALNPTAGAK